jgi:hypothetical protein
MMNSGVCGGAGLSGPGPAASESGRRAAGVPAQEKTSKTKKPQTGILKKRPKSVWFILFYRFFLPVLSGFICPREFDKERKALRITRMNANVSK